MTTIQIGYYRKEDWDKFIEIIDDKDSVHSEWEDWNQAFLKTKKGLEKSGFKVIKKVVDLDQLIEYCKKKGLKNTGSSRSQFIQQI